MLIIPEGTPRRSSRKLKTGELAYYESLEAEFRECEAKKVANKAVVDALHDLCDQSLSRAIRCAINPENRLPVELEEIEAITSKPLHDFQDTRNAVPSPRWENELKAKFGKGT